MKICSSFFEDVEIDEKGDAYVCCACRMSGISVGNIFSKSFDEIWNSKQLIKGREEALKGNYLPDFCNRDICLKIANNLFENRKEEYKPVMETYPKNIAFPIGEECNAKCIFCRDKLKIETKEEINYLKECLDKYYLNMCKNVNILTVNDSGDAFSRFSKIFIKTISEKFPKIKFKLMTNGISATKKNLDELNIYKKITEIDITISASNPKTHEKIFRVKGWNQLLDNLSYINNRVENKDIERITFNFIICQYNWKEILSFIDFAKKYNAHIHFSEVKDLTNDSLNLKYKDMTVHLQNDKNHKKFKKLLASPLLDDSKIYLTPKIKQLRTEAIKEKENSKIHKFFAKFNIN